MKTRLIYLLLILFSLQPVAFAQTGKRITLEFRNEVLPSALKKLEQISGYRILFTYDDIQNDTVTADICNETITQAIGKILQGKPLNFTLKGKEYIVIAPASVKSVNSLKGQVQNEQGVPMENTTVMLKKEGKVVTGGITDATGGYFIPNIPAGDYELCISFLGYETYTEPVTITSDRVLPEPVVLKDASLHIGEVVVTASVPAFSMKGGNIIAHVAHSVLGKETGVMDVLRKIPGMTIQNGQLTSFTGGVPLIYINGKKTLSVDEVKRLEVKNIKQVELITNPGAEYDASVSSVLLITTLRRAEGWSVQLDGELTQNHRLSNEESVKLNYQTSKLNLFGTFTYGDFRRKNHQLMKTFITTPDTVWTQDLDQQCNSMIDTSYGYSTGADYSIDDRHSIGMQYDGERTTTYNDAPSYTRILANGKPYDYIKGNSILKNDNDYSHHLNAYYTGKWNSLKIDIYADYARTHNGRVQTVTEESEHTGHAETTNSNKANYNVYAVSPKLTYVPNDKQLWVLGGEWSKVTGDNYLTYTGGKGNDARSKTDEEKRAGFLSYSYSQRNFSLHAGIRYENVASDYRNLCDAANNIRRTYHNFFPNFGLSYKQKSVSHALSYRISTIRPVFGQLNNNSYYVNTYMRQEGNPDLQPEISHLVQYTLSYDFVYVALSYRYKKNYIGTDYTTDPLYPNITNFTWRNYDNQQRWMAIVNLRRRFGWYEPSLTGIFQKNILKVKSMDERISVERPVWLVTWESNIHLPQNWLANIEYSYQSPGSIQWFTFREEHNLNLSLGKTFLNEQLQVKIAGEHLLSRRMSLYDGRINNIYFWQDEDQDQRCVSLSIVYRFNNYTKKYKGQSAADDVLNRL